MKGVSKRHLKRLIKREKQIYSNKLFSNNSYNTESNNCVNKETNSSANLEASRSNVDNVPESEVIIDSIESSPKNKTLKEKLGDWYFKNRPSRVCFEELLQILSEANLDVPLSANSFIRKKNSLYSKHFSGILLSFWCYKATF